MKKKAVFPTKIDLVVIFLVYAISYLLIKSNNFLHYIGWVIIIVFSLWLILMKIIPRMSSYGVHSNVGKILRQLKDTKYSQYSNSDINMLQNIVSDFKATTPYQVMSLSQKQAFNIRFESEYSGSYFFYQERDLLELAEEIIKIKNNYPTFDITERESKIINKHLNKYLAI